MTAEHLTELLEIHYEVVVLIQSAITEAHDTEHITGETGFLKDFRLNGTGILWEDAEAISLSFMEEHTEPTEDWHEAINNFTHEYLTTKYNDKQS